MSLADAALAAYVTARDVRGVPITIQRQTGYAPNVVTVSAKVLGVIISDAGRRHAGAGDGEALSDSYREVIVLTQDLAAASFPLPIQKNDRVVLAGATYKLDVGNVDSDTRALAGAVVLTLSGVS